MYKIKPQSGLKREIAIPPDKSISHRAAMLACLCRGKTLIAPFLQSDDTRATLDCLSKLGVSAKLKADGSLLVEGGGLRFSRARKVTLQAGESGTTMRILSGLLCAQNFATSFRASPSLRRRPMLRITEPLRQMGAAISGVKKDGNEYPPLAIRPVKRLEGTKFRLRVASAQVKSAIMLAALYAKGPTVIREPYQSRDHSERLLHLFGADITRKEREVTCNPARKLVSPQRLFIPGDFSSAAFFIVLGLICKKSELLIKNVNINHSRTGLLRVLERMGANLRILNRTNDYEPYADILVKTSPLKGTLVEHNEIASMIDELPILCVAAAYAQGKTGIFGVKELKVKETDRVHSMVSNLRAAGVNIWARPLGQEHGIVIEGLGKIKRASFRSFSDHRTAMSLIVFALASSKDYTIDNTKCINKSFPQFMSVINK